eukprot:Nk52_evm66s1401 gene=Nk52_evmTU66s1401
MLLRRIATSRGLVGQSRLMCSAHYGKSARGVSNYVVRAFSAGVRNGNSAAALPDSKFAPRTPHPFDELPKVAANHSEMTPLRFIERTASVFPGYRSVVYNDREFTWAETYQRTRKLASALSRSGVGKNDVVACVLPNVPAMLECHFGVPMTGGVLCTVNTRLNAEEISYILDHSEAKVVLVDREHGPKVKQALKLIESKGGAPQPLVIDVDDEYLDPSVGEFIGQYEYEKFLCCGYNDFEMVLPESEWDAISLNYTSGTTGRPKGVVYHHRGATLCSYSNPAMFDMNHFPVYLWTLPMFHCNGWTFPWAITNKAGTHVCLRNVNAPSIFEAIHRNKVDHFCGAPIIMQMMLDADKSVRGGRFEHKVHMMTAAAPPPSSVLQGMEETLGIKVTHVYGLTETYGPITVCAWKKEWNCVEQEMKGQLKARQGVKYDVLDDVIVADPETMEQVPWDGETQGEIFFRGNAVMKGYFKNSKATEEAFQHGWFASGDIAVMQPDGYLYIQDRRKDVIISGGENISSIEIENALYRHPGVALVGVVGLTDEKWGEVPVAFVNMKEGYGKDAKELLGFCKDQLPGFKCPKHVLFDEIPTTSTGKVKKFVMREMAKGKLLSGNNA